MRQDIAITGSINQFGEIQPIGGVNEKIEGFYKICHQRGLTGTQGVVIPQSNSSHLMLNSEVRKAVENGSFHIYTMSHIDDAITLFTGVKAGKITKKGHFSKNSVNARVLKSLESMNEKT